MKAQSMNEKLHINPMSAAAHYLASAAFWENHAKVLQHQLDVALARIDVFEKAGTSPPPDVSADKTHP